MSCSNSLKRFDYSKLSEQIQDKLYELRIHLYMGRNLPAADETGSSDPFIIFRCAG